MLITENQLDAWARTNATEAQGTVVDLVSRLVAASCPRPKERRFPLGDSIGQHGPDGYLDTEYSYLPFVPEGKSYWEIGSSERAREKASSDYSDLVNRVPERDRAESTFVFVTPRSGRTDWEYTWRPDAQKAWVKRRREQNDWKDVHVIDGTGLVDWINAFIPVQLWCAERLLGAPRHQLETLEQRWATIQSIGEPPSLSPDLFLANRQPAIEKIRDLLDGKSIQLKIATRYPEQAADFIAAMAARLPQDLQLEVFGRSVIVSGQEAWLRLVDTPNELVLIGDAELDLNSSGRTRLIQAARRGRHSVIFGGTLGGIPDPTSVDMPFPQVFEVQEILVQSGYRPERARALAQKSGGNLSVLMRCLQNLSLMPEWAEGSSASDLAVAMMLGAWSEGAESDREAVSEVSGKGYWEWIALIRDAAIRPGAPIAIHEQAWAMRSRYEAWHALGSRVYEDHLARWESVAVKVLGEPDPQFELEKRERAYASLLGKSRAYSAPLRDGMAETAALLGSQAKALTSCGPRKSQDAAARVVHALLSGADWRRWASLDDILPLLAEASPTVFLSQVEAALAAKPSQLIGVFSQEAGGVMGRTHISGLLWALETLAWSPDYIAQVGLCLAELAAVDPGGQWGNRPSASLTSILLPWVPQTCASIEKRLSCTSAILSEQPEVGWSLVLTLLHREVASSTGTRKPVWRELIPEDWVSHVTEADYWRQVSAYADQALSYVRRNPQHLGELLRHFDGLPRSQQDSLIEHLIAADLGEWQASVWSELMALALRKKRHRKDDPEVAATLTAAADAIAPKEPSILYKRLFGVRDYELYEEKGRYAEQRAGLEERRRDAIRQIQSRGGAKAVAEFAHGVESPWHVGVLYGGQGSEESDEWLSSHFPLARDEKSRQYIGGYIAARVVGAGWDWLDRAGEESWSPDLIGEFLSFAPFGRNTWSKADHLLGAGVGEYWRRAGAALGLSGDEANEAVDRLVEHGRAVAALRVLHSTLDTAAPFDSARAIRVLRCSESGSDGLSALDVHEVVDIIEALQNNPGVDEDELCKIEWLYMPVLGRHGEAKPSATYSRLARDPEFFCSVVEMVFRPSDQEEVVTVPEQSVKNGYRVLMGWSIPPGLADGVAFSHEKLEAWRVAVIERCEKSGRDRIAREILGQVLAESPGDPDGLWLHRVAASVLNESSAEPERSGFCTRMVNSRGAYYVDREGAVDRGIAAEYREKAESIELAGYSRLAVSLRGIADMYERQAEREATERYPS